jgi:hypothetical protein
MNSSEFADLRRGSKTEIAALLISLFRRQEGDHGHSQQLSNHD